MPNSPKPTNADIMAELAAAADLASRTAERVEATHNLAVKTNGRVTELEKKWERREAVEEYKQSQTQTRRSSDTNPTDNTSRDKLVERLLIALTAALSIIGALVGVSKLS